MPTNRQSEPITVIQLTDTHLFADPDGRLLNLNTLESLNQVLDLIHKNESAIDLVLATGDIAQDASEKAYIQFFRAVNSLSAQIRWVPGNHDNTQVMSSLEVAGDANKKHARISNWEIIMLDSSVVGQVYGQIGPAELKRLEAELSAARADPAIDHCLVCLHHNPVPGSSGWMQDIGLQNNDEFFQLLNRFDSVRAVVYGHIHQELDFVHQGIRCFCTPSTCIQFKPEVSDFALDENNPGYRSLRLFPDGRIESAVHRLNGQTVLADFTSSGY